ncbi:MAG: DUF2177 family protein [Burkholderiaceae bacterium]
MSRFCFAYAGTLLAMVALDMLWLGVVAKSFYQQGIGHLMAERPNIAAAVLFYAIYAAGLVIFVLAAGAETAAWNRTLMLGALFGFFAYATYDLTNLATLRNWPVGLAALDIAWGSIVSAASVAAGKAMVDRFG